MREKSLYSIWVVLMLFAVVFIAYCERPQPKLEVESVEIMHTNDVANADNTSMNEAENTQTEVTISKEHEAKQIPEKAKGRDIYLLAKIAMAEAENQDIKGKELVIQVVMNRVKSERFPDTIEAVIYQPKQFSPISDGRFDRVEPDQECYQAAQLIMNASEDISGGALYFESRSQSNWHTDYLEYLYQHGDHYFYTDKVVSKE